MSLKPIPYWPVIRYADSGKDVTALQLLLQYRGLNLTADGQFGNQTYTAVSTFQQNNGLTVDGIAGENTLLALVNGIEIQNPASNAAARAAQVLLSKFENITIDGDFYSASAQATLTFQQNMGFPAEELTSVVGIWTWYYLFGYGAYTSYDPPVQCTTDYSNNPVIDPSYLPLLNQNESFYEATEQTTGVPWEILAAIHYRENKFNRSNPNGHGPYEIGDYNYAWSYPTDAQFQQATDDCAQFLIGKMTQNRIKLRTMYETENKLRKDEVKKLFYVYNGASYYNQAISKGFTPYEANIGEGSPYVMNRADLPRDPTVYPTISDGTWGQRLVNGGPIVYPATSDYGAYLVFCALYDE